MKNDGNFVNKIEYFISNTQFILNKVGYKGSGGALYI